MYGNASGIHCEATMKQGNASKIHCAASMKHGNASGIYCEATGKNGKIPLNSAHDGYEKPVYPLANQQFNIMPS